MRTVLYWCWAETEFALSPQQSEDYFCFHTKVLMKSSNATEALQDISADGRSTSVMFLLLHSFTVVETNDGQAASTMFFSHTNKSGLSEASTRICRQREGIINVGWEGERRSENQRFTRPVRPTDSEMEVSPLLGRLTALLNLWRVSLDSRLSVDGFITASWLTQRPQLMSFSLGIVTSSSRTEDQQHLAATDPLKSCRSTTGGT